MAVSCDVLAQIATDSTLGRPATPLAGPNYAITPNLGQQVGTNLFHSFSTFNLTSAESATFSGPNSIGNIISRVTGATASSIDGLIRSTIAGANLFLINPKGILFGPNASLDLTGSFHASTANYIKLADGGRFDATNPGASVLTMAPPAAFGFLGPNPAPITVQSSTLAVSEGSSISLVGGAINVSDATLRTVAGDIRLVAMGGAGEVPVDATGASLAGMPLAPILIERSTIATDSGTGTAPGRIVIRGGQLTVTESNLASTNNEQVDAPPVELAAGGDLTVSATNITGETGGSGRGADLVLTGENVTVEHNSQVGSITWGDGRGGDIQLAASNAVRVLAAAEDPNYTNVYSWAFGNGDGGDLRLNGDAVTVQSGNVYSYTGSSGGAGSIGLTGREVSVKDGAYVISYSEWDSTGPTGAIDIAATGHAFVGGADWGGNHAFVYTQTLGSGRGGDVELRGEDVSIVEGGNVFSVAARSGRGGDIAIEASRRVRISNNNPVREESNFDRGVQSYTIDTGDAGNIRVRAQEIAIVGGFVESNTYGAGDAGSLRFEGDVIRVLGGDGGPSIIESAASNFTTGNGGNVEFRATREFQLDGTGFPSDWTRIAATTQGTGRGGDILIESPTILIDKASLFSRTRFGTGDQGGITIRTGELSIRNDGGIVSGTEGTRKGSFILIEADTVRMSDLSVIATDTSGSGDAGSVTINARRLKMTDASEIAAKEIFVDGTTGGGRAGDIVLNISESLEISDRRAVNYVNQFNGPGVAWPGGLITQAQGKGDAGNVIIRAPAILLDDGRILSTALQSGQGGRVEVHADSLVMRNGAQIDARSAEGSSGDAGSIDVAVTGRFEISGRSPIDGALSGLYAETQGSGRGGSLGIAADTLVVDRGLIRSSTSGSGDAGTIRIRAGDVLLINGGWIDAGASQGSTGAGGSIDLAATRSLALRGIDRSPVMPSLNDIEPLGITPGTPGRPQGAFPSTISSNTAGAGAGGNVNLSAPQITIADGGRVSGNSSGTGTAGNIFIQAPDWLRLYGGSVTTQALTSDGGNIEIRAGSMLRLGHAEISTSVGSGTGSGGNIFIDPTFVIMEYSRITANAFGGAGGSINIISDFFLASPESVVEASSQLGVSGRVQITAPQTDPGQSLVQLPASFVDASSLLQQSCATRAGPRASSFIGVGRGGLAAAPDGYSASRYFADTGLPLGAAGERVTAEARRDAAPPARPVVLASACMR